MKYLKTYEKSIDKWKPKLVMGDYVVVKPDTFDEDFNSYLNSQIGLVQSVYIEYSTTAVRIKYNNVPEKFQYMFLSGGNEIIFTIENIRLFSKNIKDLEYILTGEKYNL